MAPKINVKERFNDGEVDLSMSDLNEVPVKEILTLKRVHSLDLSNNSLKLLPKTFSSLISLTVLDLSRNELQELPEDFGNLIKLRHLDLYHNQLQHLPLSFSKLTNLKWLDLKDNPLVPAVAKVAGLCIDTKACQTCAKNIVHFFSKLETQVTAELEMRDRDRKKQQELNQRKKQEEKKEKKKDKQKEKENVSALEEPKKLEEEISTKPKMDTKASSKHKTIKFFFKLLFLIVLCYFILFFIDLKSSENIYDSVKVKLIDDFGTVLNVSQVFCQEFKQYVLNIYKKI